MAEYLILLISVVVAYIIGSIPTSYIFGRMLKGIDIRNHGSGNVGAANTFRVLGKTPGVTVLTVDILKGTVAATLLASLCYQLLTNVSPTGSGRVVVSEPIFRLMLGLAAICGHIWTVFLKFRGGKGVATSAGVLIGLEPATMGIVIVIFFLVLALSRYVSLSSIVAVTCLPIIIVIRYTILQKSLPIPLLVFSMVVAMIVIYRHKLNISRLLRGEENRLSFKTKTDS